jgi:hypothetical protein
MARLGSILAEVNEMPVNIAMTHDLSIKVMFFDHYCIHGRGILESKEGEASRTTSTVSHDSTRINLAKLLKVCL